MDTLGNNAASDGHERILIVEDNRAIANALKLVLQNQGYQTRWCDDDTVYGLIHDWRPSLILMDLKMPRLDGDLATATIKTDPDTCCIPVIVVTADNVSKERLSDMRADDLLTKPFPVPRLLERVSYWLTRKEEMEGGADPGSARPGWRPPDAPFGPMPRQASMPHIEISSLSLGAIGYSGQNPA